MTRRATLVASLPLLLLMVLLREATTAAAVDEREAAALASAAEEAVRRHDAGAARWKGVTGGRLSRTEVGTITSSTSREADEAAPFQRSVATATTGTKGTTEAGTATVTGSGSQLRGGVGAFDAARTAVIAKKTSPPPHGVSGGDDFLLRWAVLETTTPCELKKYPGVRQFLERRMHLYEHRVRVKWGGGDPRMVFADGDAFVGIAPLGRARHMEEVEALLKVRRLVVVTRGVGSLRRLGDRSKTKQKCTRKTQKWSKNQQ